VHRPELTALAALRASRGAVRDHSLHDCRRGRRLERREPRFDPGRVRGRIGVQQQDVRRRRQRDASVLTGTEARIGGIFHDAGAVRRGHGCGSVGAVVDHHDVADAGKRSRAVDDVADHVGVPVGDDDHVEVGLHARTLPVVR
jgi:hypothetical protein